MLATRDSSLNGVVVNNEALTCIRGENNLAKPMLPAIVVSPPVAVKSLMSSARVPVAQRYS